MVLRFRNLCILLLVAICLFSAACGGGGDGASSGTHLAVSSSSVTFTSFPYSSLPPSQSIDLSWSGSDVAALGVVYPPDVEPAPWLDLDFYGYASPLTLVFSIKSTSMPAGTYKTTVRVLAGDIDYNLLDAVDIAVTLVLTDTLAISSGSTLSFSMIHGGLLPQAKSVNLIGNEINWTASSSDPWVQLSQQSGTTPSTLSIEADPTGLAPGIHNATVEFMDGAKGDVATLQVQFTIEPNHLAISGSSDLSFNMIYGGLAPQAQAITLDGNGISWTASSSTSWVLLSEQFGNSPSTLSIEVDPTGLTPGVHDATIDFVDHLNNDTVPLHIQLTIEPNHLVVSGSSNLSFNMIYGGLAPQPQSITLDGNGINWTASSSASWILLGEQSGTSPSTLSVEVDPKELTPGVYDATINFVDHLNNDTVTLNVRFTIEPNQLAINGNSNLTFAMVDGGEWPQEELVSLIGDGAYWTASASDSWVQLSVQSGTAPVTLSLWVDQTGVPPGIHNATVDFVDVYSDRVVTLNVQLSIEPHRLFVNDNGIAMASMPSLSRLSYLVEVSENAGVSTPWTAASDQEWLSVTPGGNTGESLELIADPAGLASNIIHFATVTVSSSDPSIEGPDVIRVGLWVGSSDPNEPASLPLTYTEIAADPIRPLVYMHAGGTDIDIYNVHTGGHVRTIADVGEEIGDMEISSDGTFLFVADLAGFQIIPVDLDTYEVGLPWNVSGSGNLLLAYGRNQGKPLIFTSSGSILDAETGSKFSSVFSVNGYYQWLVPNISQNGEIACGVRMSLSPYSIECYEVEYSALNGGTLVLSSLGAIYGPGGNANDLALTRDGSIVYVASGSPYVFVEFDTSTMNQVQTLPADAFPNNVEIGSNDLLYGGVNSWYGPTDLWVYSLTGIKLADYYISGYARQIRERQLVVSGDGLRIIVSTTDPKIVMLNSP